ncbi:MAG: hypothetical protein K6A74_00010 [Lachnospiraceae bacterium]|nr:hypothetical protein [Lachnospiraceae bacterium]
MKKVLSILSSLILSVFCIYTIHDMQTAQGVGYYFCLKAGGENRLFYDVVTDVVFVLLLCICLVIPMLLCQKKTSGAFARFMILFVAFIPMVRTDYAFSLAFGRAAELAKSDIWGRIDAAIAALAVLLPFMFLVMGFAMSVKGIKLSSRKIVFMALSTLLVVLAFLVPVFTAAFLFIAAYLLIITVFEFLEETEIKSLLLYGFLFAVSFYRLLTVTAAWG